MSSHRIGLATASLVVAAALAACAVQPEGAASQGAALAAEPGVLPDPAPPAAEPAAPDGPGPDDCGCGGDQPTVDGQIAEPACDTPPLPAPEVARDDLPIGDSPRLGAMHPDVVVVFSADLQCGYCSRAHETMKKLVAAYPGRVAVVFKHNPLPFHAHALDAAVAAEAARRQGKFWEMVDLMFAHQDRLDHESLSEWARQAGLDVRAFESDLRDPALADAVRADQRLVQDHGGRGTPTFWVAGKRLLGAHPLETFRSLVDDALSGR